VSERHIKAAIAYREAAREMNVQIARLGTSGATPPPGEEKPKLNYKGSGAGASGGSKQSPLDRLMAAQNKRIAEMNSTGFDEQTVSVDSVSRQYEKSEDDALEKRRIAMEEMAAARMENTRIATEGEEAIREAMEATNKTGKDSFADLTRAVEAFSNKAADTFADFVVDGKASFSDLINSMLKDIVRLQAKQMLDPITKGASNWLSGAIGKGFESMFLQTGAPVASQGFGMAGDAGQLLGFAGGGDHAGGYRIVGEDGPELEATGPARIFSSSQTRDILSGGAGGGLTVNLIENSNKAGQVQQRQSGGQNILDIYIEKIRGAVAQDISRGSGPIPAAMEATYGMNRAAGGF
jgi:hypothetical protein